MLIVDDDEVVRRLLKEMLTILGYEPVSCPSGEDALRICTSHPEVADMVILDLVLPGISGWETLKKLQAIRPDACIILTSGCDVLKSRPDSITEQDYHGFLPKPFRLSTLMRVLRETTQAGRRNTKRPNCANASICRRPNSASFLV